MQQSLTSILWTSLSTPRISQESNDGEKTASHELPLAAVKHLTRPLAPMDLYLSGILCAVLRPPPSAFPGPFLDVALSQTAQHNALNRWVESRTAAFVLLKEVTSSRGSRDVARPRPEGNPSQALLEKRKATLAQDTCPWTTCFATERSPGRSASSDNATLALLYQADNDFDEANEYQDPMQQYYKQMVEELVGQGRYAEALALADEELEEGSSDSLLEVVILRTPEPEGVCPYVLRLKDKRRAAQLVLDYHTHWTIDECRDAVQMCLCHLSTSDELREEIVRTDQKIELFASVMAVDTMGFKTWQAVEIAGMRDGASLVRRLMHAGQYDLARKLMRQCAVQKLHGGNNEVDLQEMSSLLEQNETNKALLLLRSLGQQALPICSGLVNVVPGLAPKLFLVQYILHHRKGRADAASSFVAWELGLQLALRLPKEIQHYYESLVKFPMLLLESLMMNQRIEILHSLFHDLPHLKTDSLTVSYAEKSLQFSGQRSNSTTSNFSTPRPAPTSAVAQAAAEYKKTFSEEWTLTGNEASDAEIRKAHTYANAPSLDLCKSLLSLLTSHHERGKAATKICQSLLKNMSTQSSDVLFGLAQKLLHYGKGQFLLAPDVEGQQGVSVCDTVMGTVDVLQLLVHSNTNISVTYQDLTVPSRARMIRDKLVTDDRIKLGLEVASKCGVEAGPVWAASVLSLLRLERYEEVIARYQYYLTPSNERAGSQAGNNDVQAVMDVLENERPWSSAELHALHCELMESVHSFDTSRPGGQGYVDISAFSEDAYLETLHMAPSVEAVAPPEQVAASTNLDLARCQQCIHVLQKYGTSRQMVAFYTRHGMLADAVECAVSTKLDPSHFVTELGMPTLALGKLQSLLELLGRIKDTPPPQGVDVTARNELLSQYLLALCKYLNENKHYRLLYTVQIHMGDGLRAGLTCVMLFLNTTDVGARIRHLENAKEHFEEGLMHSTPRTAPRRPSGASSAVMTEAQIAKHLKTVVVQLDVTRYMASDTTAAKSLSTPLASLFGGEAQKNEIVSILLARNFDLAFRVINDFRLPKQPLYSAVITQLIAEKSSQQLTQLLNNIKGTSGDEEWDELVYACIEGLVQQKNTTAALKLILRLVDRTMKVKAYIECGKLKQAFDEAKDAGGPPHMVEMVAEAAIQAGDRDVASRVAKFRASRPVF